MRANPSIQAQRLDTVFYSAKRNSCLASVFFIKGDVTYGAIAEIYCGRSNALGKELQGYKLLSCPCR